MISYSRVLAGSAQGLEDREQQHGADARIEGAVDVLGAELRARVGAVHAERQVLVVPVEDPVALLEAPGVPLPLSRLSMPKAPGAPILSKSIVVWTPNVGVWLPLQFWISG